MNLNNQIKINEHIFGLDEKVYLIAEVGVNHEGSMKTAMDLIDLAKEGGADAVKFQTYKANTLASKNSPSYWDLNKEPTTSQHELFQKYDNFEKDDYVKLAEHCRKTDIDFCSTPFDDESIEFLELLMPFYKIASADLTNTPFLKKVANKKKPIILSTGASTIEEIENAINTLDKSGCEQLALLHCILNYPTENKNAHLNMITGLRNKFPGFVIGYSDHTLPNKEMDSLLIAYLLGARVLEKHFTHDKSLQGNDHYHAMDVKDLKNFKKRLRNIQEILGPEIRKRPISTEQISIKNARRSIVTSCSIKKGTVINDELITYKRPGTGISPQFWDQVIGKKVIKNLDDDHILQWSDLD